MQALTRLECLELHDNRLTCAPVCTTVLTKLKELRLERNRISKLTNLSRCSALEILSVDRNDLTSLQGLTGCGALVHLSAGDNEIEALPVKALHACRRLRELSLPRNALGSNELAGLSPVASSLVVLRLQANRIESLQTMPVLHQLQDLLLAGNRLTDGALDCLATCTPLLEVLDVSDNRFQQLESIHRPLEPLLELRELLVVGNPCTQDDTGKRTMHGWWATLREALPQLHVIQDDETGRFDSNGQCFLF